MVELQKLCDKVPSYDSKIAFATIERELGRPVDEVFSEITPEPVAAASLGQVVRLDLATFLPCHLMRLDSLVFLPSFLFDSNRTLVQSYSSSHWRDCSCQSPKASGIGNSLPRFALSS